MHELRQGESGPGDGNAGADIDASAKFLFETFRDEVAVRVKRDDAMGFRPLSMRANGCAGCGIRQVRAV